VAIFLKRVKTTFFSPGKTCLHRASVKLIEISGFFVFEAFHAAKILAPISQQFFAARSRVTRGRCYDCNFCQFFRPKLAIFSKTNLMIKFFHYLALF
jgi:hypothetical protein